MPAGRRAIFGALLGCGMALGSAMPASAQASIHAALAGSDKPITQPPPDLLPFVEDGLAALQRACDTDSAEGILASLGHLATAQRPASKAHPVVDPFRAHAPSARGFDWSNLGNQHLGAESRLALGINHRFADSSTFTTDVNLRHTAGPIDISMNIKGDRSLVTAAPVSLSYDSTAMVTLSHALRMGLAAHGDLGKLTALAPTSTQEAGPVLLLNLLGEKAIFSTSAGYDFNADANGPLPANRFHVDLGLNVKL